MTTSDREPREPVFNRQATEVGEPEPRFTIPEIKRAWVKVFQSLWSVKESPYYRRWFIEELLEQRERADRRRKRREKLDE